MSGPTRKRKPAPRIARPSAAQRHVEGLHLVPDLYASARAVLGKDPDLRDEVPEALRLIREAHTALHEVFLVLEGAPRTSLFSYAQEHYAGANLALFKAARSVDHIARTAGYYEEDGTEREP